MSARGWLAALGLLLGLAAPVGAVELTEGSNYQTIIPAQPTASAEGIEVSEYFWYGCPHCYALEPLLKTWLQTLPKDVVFRRVHADFGRWGAGARLYYALDAIGEEARLRSALFDAIHVDRLAYTREADVSDWLVARGVDRGRFSSAYNSAAVAAKVKEAQASTQAHGVDGVPTLVVGGRYRASPTTVGGHEALLAVVDALIAKLRAERMSQPR